MNKYMKYLFFVVVLLSFKAFAEIPESDDWLPGADGQSVQGVMKLIAVIVVTAVFNILCLWALWETLVAVVTQYKGLSMKPPQGSYLEMVKAAVTGAALILLGIWGNSTAISWVG